MAKANLVLPDGTTVKIEGTAEEVAILLSKFSQGEVSNARSSSKKKRVKKKGNGRTGIRKTKKQKGPMFLISELADEGYFKSKRTLGDVQKKLEERGHIYAKTSLSPTLLRLTKNKVIRRIKEKKIWIYVK